MNMIIKADIKKIKILKAITMTKMIILIKISQYLKEKKSKTKNF